MPALPSTTLSSRVVDKRSRCLVAYRPTGLMPVERADVCPRQRGVGLVRAGGAGDRMGREGPAAEPLRCLGLRGLALDCPRAVQVRPLRCGRRGRDSGDPGQPGAQHLVHAAGGSARVAAEIVLEHTKKVGRQFRTGWPPQCGRLGFWRSCGARRCHTPPPRFGPGPSKLPHPEFTAAPGLAQDKLV
jgi:hypothetical protein